MVIVINKSSSNTVVLTLTEKCTLSSPTFLFRFISDINRTEKAFIAADSSSYTDRYNQFTIIDNTTEIPLSGQMNFLPVGDWHYEVYEQSSTTNLNYLLATTMVENGKVKIVGTNTPRARHNISRTYKAYGDGT